MRELHVVLPGLADLARITFATSGAGIIPFALRWAVISVAVGPGFIVTTVTPWRERRLRKASR